MLPTHETSGRYIFLQILLPFIIGIILSSFLNLLQHWTLFISAVLVITFILTGYKQRIITTSTFYLFVTVSAIYITRYHSKEPILIKNEEAIYTIEIADDFSETTNSFRTIAEVISVNDSIFPKRPKVLVYFSKKDEFPEFFPGDILITKCKWNR